jgi:hypothetical protein
LSSAGFSSAGDGAGATRVIGAGIRSTIISLDCFLTSALAPTAPVTALLASLSWRSVKSAVPLMTSRIAWSSTCLSSCLT